MNHLDAAAGRPRIGRSPATTRGELSHIALGLFLERGFDETTVDDIVRAAGIGRRTFFRYFTSKNDLPWGEFDDLLDGMRAHLASVPRDVPLMEALRQAVVEFNRFPADEIPFHRQRMWLLLNVPDLMAHSTLRYSGWRQVVAEFVADRRGEPANSLAAQSIAWVCLSLCLAAYEQWLERDDADLLGLLDEAFDRIAEAFGAV
ncbi:mycofactocin system transcriptional regulator [Microbacterium sp. CFH 90308]|uniref:Mycofactocin system transcriptional regulator n=1 Tax=Microbacterium salsuginis TaxID=2722803 RepID=A0ABX1KGL6_9MICO|nr:mycofactocin system transcriptional regulator [Microbacterium sp. CFH 90308]NLP85133.1 mycofactocin system transcriptional regulator [Microbacterium sp. CFH 90308]